MNEVKDPSIKTFQRLFTIYNANELTIDESQKYDLLSQAIGNVLLSRNKEGTHQEIPFTYKELSVSQFFEI